MPSRLCCSAQNLLHVNNPELAERSRITLKPPQLMRMGTRKVKDRFSAHSAALGFLVSTAFGGGWWRVYREPFPSSCQDLSICLFLRPNIAGFVLHVEWSSVRGALSISEVSPNSCGSPAAQMRIRTRTLDVSSNIPTFASYAPLGNVKLDRCPSAAWYESFMMVMLLRLFLQKSCFATSRLWPRESRGKEYIACQLHGR